MELYQLRSFAMVAREGSIARAAERLFSSAPAVSAHVKALEDELAVRLFERGPQGMSLTPSGEALWEEAERVLAAARRMNERAGELRGRICGHLRLGLNNEFETIRAPELLTELAATHPEMTFATSYRSSGDIIRGLLTRELDMGYFEGPCETSALSVLPLVQREIVIVYPRRWQESLDGLELAALLRRPWVFVRPECSHYRLFRDVMAEQGVGMEPRFQVGEDMNALNLVALGLGISLSSMHQLELHPRRDEIRVWAHFRRPLMLQFGYLQERRDDPLIRHTVSAVRRVWGMDEQSGVG